MCRLRPLGAENGVVMEGVSDEKKTGWILLKLGHGQRKDRSDLDELSM